MLECERFEFRIKMGSIKAKIVEAQCDIICLQETKKDSFSDLFIKIFCPASFDTFLFKPAEGTAGGIITISKSSKFVGTLCWDL